MSVTAFENEEPREQNFVEFVNVTRVDSFFQRQLYSMNRKHEVMSHRFVFTPIDLRFDIHLLTSRIAEFTVQVGYLIGEVNKQSGRLLVVVTTTGAIIGIERKNRGNESCSWMTLSCY